MADLQGAEREDDERVTIPLLAVYLRTAIPLPGGGMRPTITARKHGVVIEYHPTRGMVVVSGAKLPNPRVVPIQNVSCMIPAFEEEDAAPKPTGRKGRRR